MRIISLTTIPSRFSSLGLTLECLLSQDADEVWLNIPISYRRFPDWDGTLPSVQSGVRIKRCKTDYGPATKVLPAAKELRGQDVQILFCDDDCIVPAGWAKRLFIEQAKRPTQVVANYVRPIYLDHSQPRQNTAWQVPLKYDLPYRTSRLAYKLFRCPLAYRRPFWIPGFGDILFGAAGAVIKPNFFNDIAFNIPDICWPVDDIWISAMLAVNKTRIYCPWLGIIPKQHEASISNALLDSNFFGMDRQELNIKASLYCQKCFGIWNKY